MSAIQNKFYKIGDVIHFGFKRTPNVVTSTIETGNNQNHQYLYLRGPRGGKSFASVTAGGTVRKSIYIKEDFVSVSK